VGCGPDRHGWDRGRGGPVGRIPAVGSGVSRAAGGCPSAARRATPVLPMSRQFSRGDARPLSRLSPADRLAPRAEARPPRAAAVRFVRPVSSRPRGCRIRPRQLGRRVARSFRSSAHGLAARGKTPRGQVPQLSQGCVPTVSRGGADRPPESRGKLDRSRAPMRLLSRGPAPGLPRPRLRAVSRRGGLEAGVPFRPRPDRFCADRGAREGRLREVSPGGPPRPAEGRTRKPRPALQAASPRGVLGLSPGSPRGAARARLQPLPHDRKLPEGLPGRVRPRPDPLPLEGPPRPARLQSLSRSGPGLGEEAGVRHVWGVPPGPPRRKGDPRWPGGGLRCLPSGGRVPAFHVHRRAAPVVGLSPRRTARARAVRAVPSQESPGRSARQPRDRRHAAAPSSRALHGLPRGRSRGPARPPERGDRVRALPRGPGVDAEHVHDRRTRPSPVPPGRSALGNPLLQLPRAGSKGAPAASGPEAPRQGGRRASARGARLCGLSRRSARRAIRAGRSSPEAPPMPALPRRAKLSALDGRCGDPWRVRFRPRGGTPSRPLRGLPPGTRGPSGGNESASRREVAPLASLHGEEGALRGLP